MCFLCARIPSRRLHYHQLSCLLTPPGCDGFFAFSCFWWSWQFWGVLVRRIIGCPFMEFVWFFSHDPTGIMDWREGGRSQGGSALHIISRQYCIRSMWFMTIDVGLGHRDEGLLVTFLYREVTPSSWLCFLEGSHCAQPTHKEPGVGGVHKEFVKIESVKKWIVLEQCLACADPYLMTCYSGGDGEVLWIGHWTVSTWKTTCKTAVGRIMMSPPPPKMSQKCMNRFPYMAKGTLLMW